MDTNEERLKLLKELKIPHASIMQNNDCSICHVVEKEMVNLGSIHLCKKCFFSEFRTDDPMNKEREFYLHLVKDSAQSVDRKNEVQPEGVK